MPETPSNQPASGSVSYNYSLDRARIVYLLLEKPADMTDHEWAIVSDEGFRRYLASQLGIKYMSRQELRNKST
jgi:hypothetical protein